MFISQVGEITTALISLADYNRLLDAAIDAEARMLQGRIRSDEPQIRIETDADMEAFRKSFLRWRLARGNRHARTDTATGTPAPKSRRSAPQSRRQH